MDILNENLRRVSATADDDQEKYTLSLSILNYIKASTLAPIQREYMLGKGKELKQLLINEDLYSSAEIGKVPVDVETSTMGAEVMNLLECLKGVNSLLPYCDVSTRVIMRMSDLLQGRWLCYAFDTTQPTEELAWSVHAH